MVLSVLVIHSLVYLCLNIDAIKKIYTHNTYT